MTIADWEKEARTMTKAELQEKIHALDTLLKWGTFATAYRDYGISVVKAILEVELRRLG